MEAIQGSWLVTMNDGSELHQYDKSSPLYMANAGEVPFKAIDWPNVANLQFQSQFANAGFDVAPAPEGFQVSLRSRHFKTQQGVAIMSFIVLVSKAGQEVNAESVVSALYWLPDGTVHECPHFDCPDVANYALKLIHGQDAGIMPATHVLETGVEGLVTE